jgi:membrane associated rhomboid family serine protease
MFPIRDDAPKSTTPFVNYFLVALNTLVFLFEVALDPRSRTLFVFQFGIVPASITGLAAGIPDTSPAGALLPILTSMFLHGSWLHLIFNMWGLIIFGDNVEDHLGHFRYLLFYVLAGIAAGLVHILFNLYSTIPSVGASGAIAGVMGAYFLLFPSARVLTLVPFFFFYFTWLPAWLVLGYWFVVQFLSGAATAITPAQQTTGGIAFWAHVGGFLAGLGLIKLFPAQRRRWVYQPRY